MAAGAREIVMMVSTGKNKEGVDTRYSYTTTKNKRNSTTKLEIKKFDPRAWNEEKGRFGLHVAFKEKKLPSSK